MGWFQHFRVVSSSIWRNFWLRLEVSRTHGSDFTEFFPQNRGSFQWRGSKRRLTLIWRNSFGVRRFDEIFFFVWLTFGYEVTTRLWSWLDRRSMFQARDHESVTLTGFQRRRFDEFFLFSFSFSPATRWVALYGRTWINFTYFSVSWSKFRSWYRWRAIVSAMRWAALWGRRTWINFT